MNPLAGAQAKTMSTWHQERNGHPLPKLSHPTQWRSYNPKGHLGVITHLTEEQCTRYCDKTGDIAVPPVLRGGSSEVVSDRADAPRLLNNTFNATNQNMTIRTCSEWLKGTKVVGNTGQPLVVYHGTFSDIKAFDKKKAGVGFLGLGFYFTDNRLDASDNYANAKKYSRLTGIDMRRFDHSGVVMPVLLALKNPIIAGGKNVTKFAIADGSLRRFIGAFLKAAASVPAVPAIGVTYMATERFPLEAQKTRGKCLTMEEIVDLIQRQLGLNTSLFHGDARPKMVLLQRAFHEMGYDGVVYDDVQKRFGEKMESITKETRHFVAFHPDQIRPAIGTDFYGQAESTRRLEADGVTSALNRDLLEQEGLEESDTAGVTAGFTQKG